MRNEERVKRKEEGGKRKEEGGKRKEEERGKRKEEIIGGNAKTYVFLMFLYASVANRCQTKGIATLS